MSEMQGPAVGSVGWIDLTVENAEEVRDFYRAVVGADATEVPMNGYSDYCLVAPGSDTPVAGVCHARGANASMPPQWIIYLVVADLDQSVATCKERGGEIVVPTRDVGGQGRFCVIRDPGGAVAALYQAG